MIAIKNWAKVFTIGLALCVSLAASAQTIDEYIALRNKSSITGPTETATLKDLIGEKTIEISGIVRGYMETSSQSMLIVEEPSGKEVFVYAKECPAWLKITNTSARMIVKVSRDSELAGLETTLLSAVSEMTFGQWEKSDAAKKAAIEAEKKRKAKASANAKRGTTTSRKSTRMPGNLPTFTSDFSSRITPDPNLDIMPVLPAYTQFILSSNKNLSPQVAQEVAYAILVNSVTYGVDARLTMALVRCESNFNPNAVSGAGAMGLGQLMPGTASGLGVSNPYDIFENASGSVRYLRKQLDRFVGQTGSEVEGLILGLAAYNAGPGAVTKYGGIPPYTETQNYVRKVLSVYKQLLGG